MSNVRLLSEFVSKEDRAAFIEIIDQLKAKVRRRNAGRTDDDRYVFFRPVDETSVELLKKYGAKVLEVLNEPGLYLHDVIYAKSEVGAEVDVHMDFDTISECNDCVYASVLYLNKDYSGGEIYFPNFGETYSPEAGDAAVFLQNDPQYVHGVKKVTNGHRYIVNICYTSNPNRVLNSYKLTV
jgi:hypothetical protein